MDESSAKRPRLAYAANRSLGARALSLLLDFGWRPVVLLLPRGRRADRVDEIRERLPGAPLIEGRDFRSPRGLELLRDLRPDYLLSVHFPYLFPPQVLAVPRIGTLNLHPAYLPFNRGWHTPTWAIEERAPFGATLHWVDSGLDTGDVVLRKRIEVRPEDTAHSLYQRVLRLEQELLREALPALAGGAPPRARQEPGGSMHRKSDLERLRRLDLSASRPLGETLDRLRALTTNDWSEAAYFESGGRRYLVRVEIRGEDAPVASGD